MNRDQQWTLFGYDTRQVGQHWLAAWRDLLWGTDSPLRQRLDEVVVTRCDAGERVYQSGVEIQGDVSLPAEPCRAICLPDDLLLHKTLTLPLAAESELPSVIALEVNANSPFSHDDTAFGWRVRERSGTQLQVDLLIASRSAIMAWLGKAHDIHDRQARELWGDSGAGMVVLGGFGEARRESRYRTRLLRAGVMSGVALGLLLLIAGLAAGARQVELGRMEALADSTAREAESAAALRTSLAEANRQIRAARDIVASYPNPHVEIARLTRLLDDTAFAAHMSVRGDVIRLRGRATDAAAVMQRLSAQPQYSEVTAPQAIVRVGNTDLEQFYLDIRLAGPVEDAGS
ncbi:MAG: hypothetical protein ABR578_09995 [Chromatocurvus sp.]